MCLSEQRKAHVHITSVWETERFAWRRRTLGAKGWHQLIVTYDGSRMAEVSRYIDGKPAKSSGREQLYRPSTTRKAFSAAVPYRGGGDRTRFRGRIDDVRVYARCSHQRSRAGSGESIHDIAQSGGRKQARSRNCSFAVLFENGPPKFRCGEAARHLRIEKEKSSAASRP